jgi:hypothetical protein
VHPKIIILVSDLRISTLKAGARIRFLTHAKGPESRNEMLQITSPASLTRGSRKMARVGCAGTENQWVIGGGSRILASLAGARNQFCLLFVREGMVA